MPEPIKDPVCGMRVQTEGSPWLVYAGTTFHFCSDLCRRTFAADPQRYAAKGAAPPAAVDPAARRIAYFSMEVALESRLPTYSGGLGVLAGDTLRSCADLRIPVVGVSLLYRRGYFTQRLDDRGDQHEDPVVWKPAEFLRLLQPVVTMMVEGRVVAVRAWQFEMKGLAGYVVPLILLDTEVDQNTPRDRELVSVLYGGDERYRLAQEAVLGMGGVRMLRALGYTSLERFHLNEGHASLLTLELLRERGSSGAGGWDFDAVQKQCVFTTHTPVSAGHDQFTYDLVSKVLGETIPLETLRMLGGSERMNMTLLALNLSHYVNGVAKRHGQVSEEMFPGYSFDSITNGVHSFTWTSDSFRELYDRHIPDWARDPFSLRYVISIPGGEIWEAHVRAKSHLLAEVKRRSGCSLAPETLTIGFARRAAAYKRHALVLSDPEALEGIATAVGPLQIIFGGKAHPRDDLGREAIREVFRGAGRMGKDVKVVYLEDYDLDLARLVTSGVDLWLNTPLPPLEASGTSGMKAAHNGVPSFSVLDGWWVEGHIEGVTGWSIGPRPHDRSEPRAADRDAADLYHKLRTVIAPLFYENRIGWADVMRHAIAFNASFFNTHRMVEQYAASAYV